MDLTAHNTDARSRLWLKMCAAHAAPMPLTYSSDHAQQPPGAMPMWPLIAVCPAFIVVPTATAVRSILV
eukprot:1182712-Prorocentrum_minimum.AAC.1